MKNVKNNSNALNESILDIEDIKKTIKENTDSTIKEMLAQTVNETIAKHILKEDEDEKEDSYEIEDVTTDDTENSDETDETTEVETSEEESSDADETDSEADTVETEENDEWSEFDEFKTEDGDYDMTNVEEPEKLVKVWKLIGDDESISVSKEDDKIHISDNETGAEYMVEMPDEMDDESLADTSEDEFELELDESTNLGYTDNYQKRDVMTNDGMAEPANPKATRKVDAGVPTGTEKPWAGKGNPEPFNEEEIVGDDEEIVPADEEGEGIVGEVTTVTSGNARTMSKTNTSSSRRGNLPMGSKNISAAGKFDGNVTEAILKKAKAIFEENKKYKAAIENIKKSLHETVVVNVSLGQMVKLMMENTTTQDEKREIVKRFNECKSVKESKALYESFSRELKKVQQPNMTAIDKQLNESTSTVVETPVYHSEGLDKIKDLAKRMKLY